MDIQELTKRAIEIKEKYDNLNIAQGNKEWDFSQYAEGFVSDVGDLMKLVLAKAGHRKIDGDVDVLLKHEMADCLWSVLVISKILEIDLAKEFLEGMDNLSLIIDQKIKEASQLQ